MRFLALPVIFVIISVPVLSQDANKDTYQQKLDAFAFKDKSCYLPPLVHLNNNNAKQNEYFLKFEKFQTCINDRINNDNIAIKSLIENDLDGEYKTDGTGNITWSVPPGCDCEKRIEKLFKTAEDRNDKDLKKYDKTLKRMKRDWRGWRWN